MAVATPRGYDTPADIQAFANESKNVTWHRQPIEAVKDADIIITDTWVSMGMESEKARRLHDFKGFKVCFGSHTEGSDHK